MDATGIGVIPLAGNVVDKMLILLTALLTLSSTAFCGTTSSSVSKDLLDEHSDNVHCHWKSHVAVSLERHDGTVQSVDRIPWSVVCGIFPQNCTEVDGILQPVLAYQVRRMNIGMVV